MSAKLAMVNNKQQILNNNNNSRQDDQNEFSLIKNSKHHHHQQQQQQPYNQHQSHQQAPIMSNNLLTSSTSSGGIVLQNISANINGSNVLAPMPNGAAILNQNVDFSIMDEKEKKIVAEFIHLLDKSKQLFNGLRDLPQYGHKNNQWQAYFGRTFDVYTKLWKFQQQHRQILDQKYNLKRWQIGEIASKIGQLYYHYYLRTSESNYLNESFSFYQAIQTRAYYSKANKEEKPDLMVKKLRYYARFIVVCLLLKKTKQVRDLIRELSKQIDEYVKIYDPEDQLEWQLVKNEINDFIDADSIVNVDNVNVVLSSRLNQSQVPSIGPNTLNSSDLLFKSNAIGSSHLTLQEIIIVGNCQDQIKFSELSLDMFRMLQAVEREPTSSSNNPTDINNLNEKNLTNSFSGDKSPATSLFLHEADRSRDNNTQTIIQRENPHKYLLYKPSFSQFYTYIAAAFKDLAPHNVMMVYVSADSCEIHSKSPLENAYDFGGVRTNNKKDAITNSSNNNSNTANHPSNYHHSIGNSQFDTSFSRKSSYFKESHCIYPGDLYAFLRKPLFLIVDSGNSSAFQNFPNLFGQPFVSLLSPVTLPNIFQDRQYQQGNIFTLFLTNPLFAFCYVCNINNLNVDTFNKSQAQLKQIFLEIAKAFYKSKHIDNVVLQFCNDDFLRVFVFRFVFCYSCLRLHRGFKGSDFYPSSQPQMPNDIIENAQIHRMILDLALILNIRPLFLDVSDD